MTETLAAIATAMAKLQQKLPEIRKSETAKVETQKGSYSYTYANLAGISAQIMPMLGELGLSFIAKPMFHDDRFVLAYSLLHESGEHIDGEYPLPTSGTPQAIGSAITYGRRYCLCAVTGVAPEDDDDGAAAEAEASTRRGTAQRAQPRAARAPAKSAEKERPTAQRASAQPPPLPGEDGKDAVNRPQLSKIMVLFQEIGWSDRADRLRASSAIVGRELTTANDLSVAEASTLIDTLQMVASVPDPQTRLGELISGVAEAEPVDGEVKP